MNGSTEGLCPQYSYNEVTNQISNTGYSYDAAGNLLNDGTYSYTYDANGRVVSDTSATGWQYPMYNALGQRVQDHQSAGSNDSTYLMYPQDTFGRRTEIFEYHPSVGWVGADIWFAQVAGQRIKMGGSTSWLLHSDALGSSTMETDQTGAVDWDGNFYPYGQPWHAGNGEVSFAGLGYPVNEPVLPSATRGYNPTLGRWLTPDPAGMAAAIPSNPQTWNMYAYALDNPTSLSDPSGEDYRVCIQSAGKKQCTDVQNEAAFQSALANPGAGITVTGNNDSGTIYGTNASGQKVQVGTYEEVAGPGTEGGGLQDQTVNLLALEGIAEAGVRGIAALGDAGISAIRGVLGSGEPEVQTLNIGRFVTGQVIRRTIQTVEGPLDITGTVEVRGSTIVLRNFDVVPPGGVGVTTNPGVFKLKAAIDALKAEFAADGFSRVIFQGLRITGANAPRYVNIPLRLP